MLPSRLCRNSKDCNRFPCGWWVLRNKSGDFAKGYYFLGVPDRLEFEHLASSGRASGTTVGTVQRDSERELKIHAWLLAKDFSDPLVPNQIQAFVEPY